ncbi:MAG: hypothetical protein J6S57_00545 [Alphaproteobacteria bacterium]|nr:hypothetical protein [Alphaproteobacteria bacterium]
MFTHKQILLKIVGAYILFSCCMIDGVIATSILSDSIFTICKKNYYIAKCGSSTIGTNLLKGFSCEYCDDAVNYYDYSEQNNIENLRKFFNSCPAESVGPQYLSYENYDGQSSLTSNDVFCNQRTAFLQNICMPPSDISSEFFTCLPCPDNGVTDTASTMKLVYEENRFVWETFHTFVDCYKNDFEDSTGKYVYVNNTNYQPEKCYYTSEIRGDSLVSEMTEIGISAHIMQTISSEQPAQN